MLRPISMCMSGVAAAVLVLATPTLLDTSAMSAQGKRIEHSKNVKHAYRVHRIRPAECLDMPWHRSCTRALSAFGFVGPATGPGPGLGVEGGPGSGPSFGGEPGFGPSVGGGFGSGPSAGGGFGSGPSAGGAFGSGPSVGG